jgi:hypothetical protein
MKVLGWILLFLSAASMAMCTAAGPETREYVTAPEGVWTWLVWFAVLISGAWLVFGRLPADPAAETRPAHELGHVLPAVIVVVGLISAVLIHSQFNRYATFGADNRVYKLDRWSGAVTALVGMQEYLVEPVIDDAAQAIRLAKGSLLLDPAARLSSETIIRQLLEESAEEIQFGGWEARAVDAETYLVTFSMTMPNGPRGWAFEVVPDVDLVRDVLSSSSLRRKYGYAPSAPQ